MDSIRCEACGESAHWEDFLGAYIHSDGEDHGHNVVTAHMLAQGYERPAWISVVWADDRVTYEDDTMHGVKVKTHGVRRTIHGYIAFRADERAQGHSFSCDDLWLSRVSLDASFIHRELIGNWVRHCPTLVIK